MQASFRISRFLYTVQLLTVYASFFLVQFFFNFNAAAETQSPSAASVFSIAHNDHAEQVFKNHLPGSRKVNIRLNKRFQLPYIPLCTAMVTASPAQYFISRNFGRYIHPFLSSAIPLATPLRGPPVMV